jgi:hypothetical protein
MINDTANCASAKAYCCHAIERRNQATARVVNYRTILASTVPHCVMVVMSDDIVACDGIAAACTSARRWHVEKTRSGRHACVARRASLTHRPPHFAWSVVMSRRVMRCDVCEAGRRLTCTATHRKTQSDGRTFVAFRRVPPLYVPRCGGDDDRLGGVMRVMAMLQPVPARAIAARIEDAIRAKSAFVLCRYSCVPPLRDV